jgi:hypothetical protein
LRLSWIGASLGGNERPTAPDAAVICSFPRCTSHSGRTKLLAIYPIAG